MNVNPGKHHTKHAREISKRQRRYIKSSLQTGCFRYQVRIRGGGKPRRQHGATMEIAGGGGCGVVQGQKQDRIYHEK